MPVTVRRLGVQDYLSTWEAMRGFTQNRDAKTLDELWVVEHPPVYTQGLAGKQEHILNSAGIPVVHSDRGGQVTYHGPGQLVVYTLVDLNRAKLNSRQLVTALEQAMVSTLAGFGIRAEARADAPGVYVDGKKIGSIGLRIKKNCSYHGLSLNNAMDLSPFKNINPCGYQDLQMTQLADLGVTLNTSALADLVVQALTQAIYP